jgi:hypothetical protein
MNEIAPVTALIIFLTAALPSFAATVTAEYRGTFIDLTDGIGLFGPRGASYSDQPFALSATFDVKTYTSGGNGGVAFGDGVSGGSPVMTVNGIDYHFETTDSSLEVFHELDPFNPVFDSLDLIVSGGPSLPLYVSLQTNGQFNLLPRSILDPASISCETGITCFGNLDLAAGGHVTQGDLAVSQFSSTVSPVPPALPLFISALSGLGLYGWRHRNGLA